MPQSTLLSDVEVGIAGLEGAILGGRLDEPSRRVPRAGREVD
jgi:hypothetical protein